MEKAKKGRRTHEHVQERLADLGQQLEAYEALCGELGEQPADVALAWLLNNPLVTAPIIGPRTMDQLTGSRHSLEIKLDPGTLEKIDTIWPGPGGIAPEAYAW
jgi:aryl-alcohol dehydrogenase-like predicted oxidoreductase